MSRQYFQIDRAPEVQPVEAARIKRLLRGDRRDTEWEVKEVKDCGQLKRENTQLRRWVVKLMSLVEMNGPAADVYCEIRAKLPGLFKAKRRGSE